jgi:hypothetical protein
MKLTDLITKMDNSKRFDGHFNHEILSAMPTIEALIRSLQTMSLEEFALLQAGIEPVEVDDSCPCERCKFCTDDYINMCEECMVNGYEHFEEKV